MSSVISFTYLAYFLRNEKLCHSDLDRNLRHAPETGIIICVRREVTVPMARRHSARERPLFTE